MESGLGTGECVLSGMVNLNVLFGRWNGFHATHIFPLHSKSWWNDQNYGGWIRDVTWCGIHQLSSNGFLLRADIHADFSNYVVSADPDVYIILVLILVAYTDMDGYKVIVFGGLDVFGIDGRSPDLFAMIQRIFIGFQMNFSTGISANQSLPTWER